MYATRAANRGGVFAVGSLVRANLRPVAKKSKNFSPPKFLPYEVLEAARRGDVAPLLQLRGEYTVPKDLMRNISSTMIGAGSTEPMAQLSGGGIHSTNITSCEEPKMGNDMVSSHSNDSIGNAIGAVRSSLDPEGIDAVSLTSALALAHGGDETVVDRLSTQNISYDVDEIEDDIPVLASAGSNTPLSREERELFSAVTVGDVDKVFDILQSGKINTRSVHPDSGATILHLAAVCLEPDVRTSTTLLSAPVIPKDQPTSMTTYDEDVENMGTVSGVRISLLNAIHNFDASLVNSIAFNGSTPLHWAAGAGHLDSVDWLLRHGADPLAATHTWTRNYFSTGSGQTPLHWAAQSNHAAVVEKLVGASPLGLIVVDEKGRSAMAVAEEEQTVNSKAYQALLAAGEEEWLELELTHEAPLSRPLQS